MTTTLDQKVHIYERSLIAEALAQTKGNMRAAAKSLGVNERTFWRRCEKHSLDPALFRVGAQVDAQ